MTFSSIEYLLFLPVVFFIYWLLQNRVKLQNLFIVLASYVFEGWWDWRYLCLIAFTSFISWGSGLLIKETKWKKFWMISNIIVNLSILLVFKYYNFFVGEFCELLRIENPFVLEFLLPVGISFYTFQAISYTIDVFRKDISPTNDPIAFFAYVSFFPQLVAGPIERATNLLPQFYSKRVFRMDMSVEGMRRILWGLFKKLVIADNCAMYVDAVWNDYSCFGSSTLLLAAFLFSFQIYGDFSGYSDIAIGSAKLFGINLKDNFLFPYFSRNVGEFWKRWHISLNTWFVDYVYIPLGGSRKGKGKTVINTFIIFLLSGLWHGANWKYVCWGGYHSFLFIPLILTGRNKSYNKNIASISSIHRIISTFILVTIGWVIFRAPCIQDAYHYFGSIFDSTIFSIPWLMSRKFYACTFVGILIMIIVEWIGRKNSYSLAWLKGKSKFIKWSIYYVLIIMIYCWRVEEDIQFIYFQF